MSSSAPTPSSSSSSRLGGMSSAGPSSSKKFRHAVLKNLLLGLSKGGGAASPSSSSSGMSLSERRDAVRHAADAALTTARGAAPLWSRALAADLSSHSQHGRRHRRPTTSWDDDGEHHLVDLATRSTRPSSNQCESSSSSSTTTTKMVSRKRLRRARPKSRATARAAGAVARVMARRWRARALREMVPGGRGMVDECTLLGETLDYAVSLKAQVEAMQLLLRTLQQQAPKNKNPLLKQ